jgi:NADH oxidase (H2O2-forming)
VGPRRSIPRGHRLYRKEDVAYSPCGIPFVHGKEIPSFEALFLAEKQAYVDAGIDVHYETRVVDRLGEQTITVDGEERSATTPW